MLEVIVLIIAGAILIAGTVTDIRWREVPDWLSYAGLIAGLSIRAISSVDDWSWLPLLEGLVGLGVFFLFGEIMYSLGQWGGGDSKILMAMGALLGIPAAIGLEDATYWLVLLALTVAFVMRLLWIIALVIVNRRRGIRSIDSLKFYAGIVSNTLGKFYDFFLIFAVGTAGVGVTGFVRTGADWWLLFILAGFVPWLFVIGWVMSSDFFLPRVFLHRLIEGDRPAENIVTSFVVWKYGNAPLHEQEVKKLSQAKSDHQVVGLEPGSITILVWILIYIGILVAANVILAAAGVFSGYLPDLWSVGIAFFVNAIIMGGLYGVVWITALTIWHWKKVRLEAAKRIALAEFCKVRNICLGVAVVMVLTSLVLPIWLRWSVMAIGLLLVPFCYLFVLVKSVEVCCMHKQLKPSALTEGDWVIEEVIVGGKRICGPEDLGLDLNQIRHIQELHAQQKIKTILVKEGIPFVPGFLLGFGMMLLVGNLLLKAAVWLLGTA